jgi:mono/diheme cytochrome c family protein
MTAGETSSNAATRPRRAAIALACAVATSWCACALAADAGEAARIFNQRCTACHTFGRGVKVGPDLKGVTDRRARPWLLRFVRGSSSVIASGDPTATALFAEFKSVRMPDWSDLSEDQVGAIMDWFAADGPEHQKEADERSATLAEAADVEMGRELFAGGRRLATGGLPCAGCHALRDARSALGGSFGPDLTTVYARYQDRALTSFLKHPCFPRMPDSAASRYLLAEEAFALKSYLRTIAMANREEGRAP